MGSMNAPKLLLLFLVFFGVFSSASAWAAGDEEIDDFGTEMKARQAHERASSDMIYQNEEWKALYYQNQQIIQLLKDISDSLNFMKTRIAVKDVEK